MYFDEDANVTPHGSNFKRTFEFYSGIRSSSKLQATVHLQRSELLIRFVCVL